jgi:hypothetical protein
MTATYEKIATTTFSTATSTINFTSISGSYTDLVLVINHSSSSISGLIGININNDSTNNNYSNTRLTWDAGGFGADRSNNANAFNQHFISWGRTNMGTTIVNFNNYSNTTTYKSIITRTSNIANSTAGQGMVGVILWRSTSAINQITLTQSSAIDFNVGTMATIYGIKAE